MRRAALVAVPLTVLAAASAWAYVSRRQAAPTVVALVEQERPLATAAAAAQPPTESAFTRLPPLLWTNVGVPSVEVRLYDASGQVDEAAARRIDQILADTREPRNPQSAPIDRRTLQLIYRAAYHFESRRVEVISGYRKPGRRREGLHATGQAVDFKLAGVKAVELASYLRKLKRVGVGVYTHPKTAYVHLDVRDSSYHWLDASPPRRNWREQSLGRIAPVHDASYRREEDWPDGLGAPLP